MSINLFSNYYKFQTMNIFNIVFPFVFWARDLSDNSIDGAIPQNLPSTLKILYYIIMLCFINFFFQNSLEFQVSFSIGALISLFVTVSGNQFTGSIPITLSYLTSLSDHESSQFWICRLMLQRVMFLFL